MSSRYEWLYIDETRFEISFVRARIKNQKGKCLYNHRKMRGFHEKFLQLLAQMTCWIMF